MINLMYTVRICLLGSMRSSFYRWLVETTPGGFDISRDLQAPHLFCHFHASGRAMKTNQMEIDFI